MNITKHNCLLCGNNIKRPVTLSFILSFRPYVPPIVCNQCLNQFIKINPKQICKKCGRSGTFDHYECHDCIKWSKHSKMSFKNRSLYQYNQAMSDFMHQYKFAGNYHLRNVFKNEFSLQLVQMKEVVVVPIPITPDTMKTRGFNQVIGLLSGIEYMDALATNDRKKETPQSHLNRHERLKMQQPFYVKEQFKSKIKNKKIILVDDIYTTGTTIRLAASLIYKYKAQSVNGFTFAR
ncbi:phosphoribosyltransferase [Philodulcilactobacillus myokoensis]|uniref:Phosphoribosyltransferase n=1 Tax=Philodulcilactobacillus myokoensis TaxID=2929573 RepID=A0A9W6B2B6_9LACO|nr:phosphoribosyltransferase family protein [Philodulcilactobacillus myokoensis]GLB47145.1 phosphoribosyltransferase [Philodulcilactobacillus myokoensis]